MDFIHYLSLRKPADLDLHCQWLSQNAEKVTLIKWRLLDQAMILFNCISLFEMGTSFKGKNLHPEEANSFL